MGWTMLDSVNVCKVDCVIFWDDDLDYSFECLPDLSAYCIQRSRLQRAMLCGRVAHFMFCDQDYLQCNYPLPDSAGHGEAREA